MSSENQNQQTYISIDEEKKDFETFLDLENNNRIFFSGKFGVGKTFFLKEFAKTKEDAYFVIHLFPVNYQIRDNLIDVVELIKYDILFELFSKEKDLVEKTLEKYNRDKSLRSFFKKNKRHLAKTAFSLLVELSKFFELTGKSLSVLGDVYETWNSFKRKEEIIVKSFLDRQKEQLKETDFISQFIYKLIQQIQNEKGKKTILILDDLDRLDPDNIFRILNVFSAFFEKENDFEKENENKFGFSKIIIVGDYDNLRKIFHHKFGEETDFEGYIDKFFSIRPYFFENYYSVLIAIDELLKKFNVSIKIKNVEIFLKFVKYFFVQTMKFRLINLRKILKPLKYRLYSQLSFKRDREYTRKDYFDKTIELLIEIFDSEVNFIETIKKIEKNIKQFEELLFMNHYKNAVSEEYRNFFKGACFLMWKELKGRDFQNSSYFVSSLGDSLSFKTNLTTKLIEPERETDLERIFLAILREYVRKGLFWHY